MKRLLFACALVFALIGTFAPPLFARENQKIPVLIDGIEVTFDVPPVIQNGRTLVPFRAIAEALNITVTWDSGTQTIMGNDGKTIVKLQIDNKTVYLNDAPVVLEVAPKIQNDRTLIPLRFFSEAYNCEVLWNDSTNTVLITSPPKKMSVIGFYALGDNKTSSWTNLFGSPYPEFGEGNTDIVTELALGWYSIDKDGNLLTDSKTGWQKPTGWEQVLETAKTYGLKTEMVVHATNKGNTIASMLESDDAMNNAVNNIMEEAVLYQGINLDFEGLGFRDEGEELEAIRMAFNRFVKTLAEKAGALNLDLTLTLHPPNSAYPGYDYHTLGKIANKVIIMAYDYGEKPEPILLVTQAVELALKAIPKDKLVLGISIPSENPDSILTKVGIAKKYQLEGIALWRLGLLTEEMWDVLRNSIGVLNKDLPVNTLSP